MRVATAMTDQHDDVPRSGADATGIPHLICLKGAPIYDPHAQCAYHAEILSAQFSGEIWFGSDKDFDLNVGRFRLRGIKLPSFGFASQLRFMLPQIQADLSRRKAELSGRRKFVLAYDPLTQGIMGAALASGIGARLIVELPGDYARLANYMDGTTPPWRQQLVRLRNLAAAQAVAFRADAFREIYPGQARTVARLPGGLVVADYFDGIKLDQFSPDPAAREKVVLFAGTPFPRKGVDILIDAWAGLANRFPDWRLCVVGHDLARHMDATLVQRHRIEVVSGIPNAIMARYIKSCSIFVLPSRAEGLPRVLIEAAASGVARIGSRVSGIPKIIRDGIDGLLFEPGNVPELRAALERLMSDEALRVQLGAAAQERVHRLFSAQAYVADLESCIEKIESQPYRKSGEARR